MQAITVEVREYLSRKDSLFRAEVAQRYPHLEQTLNDPKTRTALLDWLASDAAWDPAVSGFTDNCLEFLRVGADAGESQIVRAFLLHTNPYIRLHTYDFLLTLYFPDRNREAMLLLFQSMLSDNDDMVRTQATSYIEHAGAVSELKDFLQQWHKSAPHRGWAGTESFELIERLLNKQ